MNSDKLLFCDTTGNGFIPIDLNNSSANFTSLWFKYKDILVFFSKSKNFSILRDAQYIPVLLFFSSIPFRNICPENIIFIAGNVGFGMMILTISLALYLLYVAIKIRKERKSVYNSFLLIFFILIIVSPIQVFFPNISFMPLLTIFISYILYYNLEDPDIEMLEEVEKLIKLL